MWLNSIQRTRVRFSLIVNTLNLTADAADETQCIIHSHFHFIIIKSIEIEMVGWNFAVLYICFCKERGVNFVCSLLLPFFAASFNFTILSLSSSVLSLFIILTKCIFKAYNTKRRNAFLLFKFFFFFVLGLFSI